MQAHEEEEEENEEESQCSVESEDDNMHDINFRREIEHGAKLKA